MSCPQVFPFLLASSCTTSSYTTFNGVEACGIVLPSQLNYYQALSACINLGAKLPEPKNLAEMQNILKIMVKIYDWVILHAENVSNI